jgi:hypothetical protein
MASDDRGDKAWPESGYLDCRGDKPPGVLTW